MKIRGWVVAVKRGWGGPEGYCYCDLITFEDERCGVPEHAAMSVVDLLISFCPEKHMHASQDA